MGKKYSLCVHIIFAAAVSCALIFGIIQTVQSVKKAQKYPQRFLGQKFFGISDMIQKERHVGYLSQNSIDTDKQAAAEFAQAQLVLAPVIIEYGKTDLNFLIYNTDDPGKAVEQIHQLGFLPLKINHFGTILAKRKNP